MKQLQNYNDVDLLENILGKNIVNFASEVDHDIETFSSGSLQLDKALGINGYPVGKIIEIYGNESSGKTTMALLAIKEAQKIGKKCLFIDIENSLEIKYAEKIGINIKDLLVAYPNSGEQVFEIIELMIKHNHIDLIVVDSVAAMLPNSEKLASVDEQQMGLHARLMSKGLRRLQSLLLTNKCTVIFLNQIREKIGVFFGNPETTTGGKALKFYTSLRIETRKVDLIKDNNNKIGIQTKLTITKNKMAAPLKTALLNIYFEQGFDPSDEIIDFAIQYEVIKKNGSWYAFNDQKIAQGRNQLNQYVKENPEVFEEIKKITIAQIK